MKQMKKYNVDMNKKYLYYIYEKKFNILGGKEDEAKNFKRNNSNVINFNINNGKCNNAMC